MALNRYAMHKLYATQEGETPRFGVNQVQHYLEQQAERQEETSNERYVIAQEWKEAETHLPVLFPDGSTNWQKEHEYWAGLLEDLSALSLFRAAEYSELREWLQEKEHKARLKLSSFIARQNNRRRDQQPKERRRR